MNFKIIEYQTDEYQEMLALRTRILREPLGLIFTDEDIKMDKDDMLLGLILPEKRKMAACCILTRIDDKVVKMRQMAVDTDMQKSGLGTSMLSFAEYVAEREGFEKIVLHARKVAVDFYRKYDYKIIGDEFTEVGIPHFEMEK